MRQVRFALQYEHSHDPLMDAFIEYPGLYASSLDISVSTAGLWRIDRIAGPSDGLDAVENVFLDPEICNECEPAQTDCGKSYEYEVIERSSNRCTLYTRARGEGSCHSVPYLAIKYCGNGLFFSSKRRGGTNEWTVLLPDGANVGSLYDALDSELCGSPRIHLQQVDEPSHWKDALVTRADLPYEQRLALEAAIDAGYYQTPKGITLDELSERLSLPRSTLRYRLRRAEEFVMTQFERFDSLPTSSRASRSDIQ
ncbi:helix-turn-helix domain-containing protein [Salinirubellus salinus]|uniref:Helix-turn-helix domain-containing protein n=1 Tax=Salinirubellus salinus TaxID=1364945 RepID=A0A9E7QZW9_9EURY|nr:helix-turn-helix domain-containing protein [Salinirubellus salinus]UWM53067.1 helix-turn-helix domain-containing protein [Salinirubellus salinus]